MNYTDMSLTRLMLRKQDRSRARVQALERTNSAMESFKTLLSASKNHRPSPKLLASLALFGHFPACREKRIWRVWVWEWGRNKRKNGGKEEEKWSKQELQPRLEVKSLGFKSRKIPRFQSQIPEQGRRLFFGTFWEKSEKLSTTNVIDKENQIWKKIRGRSATASAGSKDFRFKDWVKDGIE